MTTTKSPTAKPATKKRAPTKKKEAMTDERFGSVVRMMILIWSGGLLTLYYLGGLTRLDTTFIGGLLTQTLAAFGITLGSQKKDKKKDELSDQPVKKAPKID